MTILHRKAVKHHHDSRPVRLASVYVQVEDSGGECLTMLLSDDTYYLIILKHIVFFLTLFHMLTVVFNFSFLKYIYIFLFIISIIDNLGGVCFFYLILNIIFFELNVE